MIAILRRTLYQGHLSLDIKLDLWASSPMEVWADIAQGCSSSFFTALMKAVSFLMLSLVQN